jgi:outer membrane protein assembly factor BamA
MFPANRNRVPLALLAALMATAAPLRGQAPAEVIAEVRVHGNHTTPDADVLALAGLSVGQAMTQATVADAERRLRESGRFASVEIRKRYRSLDRLDDVALVIVVREHPLVEDPASRAPAVVRPFKRLLASGMLMPIVSYTDGYGFTYGARVSFVHVLGRDGRVSVPLTWGATRRAAVELEKRVPAGPVDRLVGGVETWRRENPFYEQLERRTGGWLAASGRVAGLLRAGVRGAVADVRFGTAGGAAGPAVVDERLSTYGAEVSVDTRHDPVFPRNAIYARGGWEALRPDVSGRANRHAAEARAYLGLIRQTVLSVHWQYTGSDAPLPLYERALLGGADSVRGYEAGRDSGDNLMAASAELRVPLNSPLEIGRTGISLFVDRGRVWDHGKRASDSPWRTGGGVGVFFLASLFQLNAGLAVRDGGGVRLHVSTGLQF